MKKILKTFLIIKILNNRTIPPITATLLMPRSAPNLLVSSSICWANSLLGGLVDVDVHDAVDEDILDGYVDVEYLVGAMMTA